MAGDIPESKPIRRAPLILGIGGGLVLILAWWVGANSKRLLVWYHKRQMISGWRETHSQPEVRMGNLIGVTLGEAWKRYEDSRDALVELGAYRLAHYQFQVLKEGTPDRKHLVRRLMSEGDGTREMPPAVNWEMSDSPSGLSTMRMWGPPEDVEALLVDLRTHDVADYTDRFRKPSVLADVQGSVQKWPTLGMWLPDEREVRLFREHYDLTRDVLKKEIRNPDEKFRGKVLYVVQELEGTARDLGPDLVEMLTIAPPGRPGRSVVRALTTIRYRSPECQRELSRHWDAAGASVDTLLSLAAAQAVLSESPEERRRGEAFLVRWLQPVPETLDAAERKAYLETQFTAIITVNAVRGLSVVEGPLERLLENPAASWMRTQIPNALGRIREPVEDAP